MDHIATDPPLSPGCAPPDPDPAPPVTQRRKYRSRALARATVAWFAPADVTAVPLHFVQSPSVLKDHAMQRHQHRRCCQPRLERRHQGLCRHHRLYFPHAPKLRLLCNRRGISNIEIDTFSPSLCRSSSFAPLLIPKEQAMPLVHRCR